MRGDSHPGAPWCLLQYHWARSKREIPETVSTILRKYIWETLGETNLLTSQGLGKLLCLVILQGGVTIDCISQTF